MTDTNTAKDYAIANLRHLYKQMVDGGVKDSAQARRIAEMLLSPAISKIEQAARSAPVVPQGWRLVPIEPTDAMEQAAADYLGECVKAHGLWVAMLAEAPQPPEEIK